jgi:DNA polymerase III subunit delta'
MDSLFDASLFDASLFDAAPQITEPLPTVDEPDELEQAELRGELDTVTEATSSVIEHDPGDDLNDPTWEPPIDETILAAGELGDDPKLPADTDDTDSLHQDGLPVRGPSSDLLWGGVVGQTEAVATLRASSIAPLHAYLLVGPPGSGRRAAARAFAAAVLCQHGGCGTCDVCRRVQSVVHPDFIEIEREGASISVDQAREIIRLALRSPTEGEYKVLVLVDFHLVTNAAPTLLKIIEEPPPSTVFVVLADQVTPELVTIASRCVQVRFGALPVQVVIDALVASGADPTAAERAARSSGGRLERARLLVDDDQLGERLSFWEGVPRRVNGTGSAASALAAEALVRVEGAAVEPLEARHAVELAALDKKLEASGARGGIGMRKELTERHRRELKRLRDDELRFGLSILERSYRAALTTDGVNGPGVLTALDAIRTLNEDLIRNPAMTLALTDLFLRFPSL